MRFSKISLCAAAVAAVSIAFADAANTLVAFSTKGDKYADGTTVQDGEWYALCWSANETFGGLSSECEPLIVGDRVLLMAPLAEGGRCPDVVFQIKSSEAPTSGNYFVYMLDTRGLDGKPSKAVNKKPAMVNAVVATTASDSVKVGRDGIAVSSYLTGKDLEKDGSGAIAWSESGVDNVGQPEIKSFRIDGDRVKIKVEKMHPSVRYNIFTGSEPGNITKTTLDSPVSDESNSVEFDLDKDQGKFFKVGRQPLTK